MNRLSITFSNQLLLTSDMQGTTSHNETESYTDWNLFQGKVVTPRRSVL